MHALEVSPPTIQVIRPDETIGCHWLDGAMHVYDTGANSGYAMTWLRTRVEPGSGPDWHVHTREDELFYVRSGRFAFEVPNGPGRAEVGPGGLITLPVGVPHRFNNVGEVAGELISLNVPGGLPQFFVELSNRLDQPFKVPSEEEFARAGARFGAVFVPREQNPSDAILPISKGRTADVARRPAAAPPADGAQVTPLSPVGGDAPDFAVAHLALAPGVSLPRHQHARHTVGLYILEGTLALRGDGFSGTLGSDQLAILPFGVSYAFASDAGAELLVATNPAGLLPAWDRAWRQG